MLSFVVHSLPDTICSYIGCFWWWASRHNDVSEFFLTDGPEGESKHTDGEARYADAGNCVLEEVGTASADESCGLGVVGLIVGGAFEDSGEGCGGAHVG